MVGDTPADTLMGQKAKLGLTVGVLSGVGDKEDLADADVIVNDVTNCVDMILKPVEGRVHQVTSVARCCQMAIFDPFLLRLRYATLQNLILSFPWIETG